MRIQRLCKLYLWGACILAAVTAGWAAAPPSASFLPEQFAGWQRAGTSAVTSDAAAADPVNAAVLKEFGFKDFQPATFVREDGRKLTVKAARFVDASGAFGAFTFYRLPQMRTEEIGDVGVSLNNRVLFSRGNILIDAVFSKPSAMSAAELRELASALPRPASDAQKLPDLPGYLPKSKYVENSAKYVVGPLALPQATTALTPELVDFNAGAEVVTANFTTETSPATLILISYPTPQIAAEHLRRIEAAHGAEGASAQPALFSKRTGPLVVVATGSISEADARSLLAQVNYEADVTWNEKTATKKDNLANLLVNIIVLCAIMVGLMLVAGLGFGGARILLGRVFASRRGGQGGGEDFISLGLEESAPNRMESPLSSTLPSVYPGKNGK